MEHGDLSKKQKKNRQNPSQITTIIKYSYNGFNFYSLSGIVFSMFNGAFHSKSSKLFIIVIHFVGVAWWIYNLASILNWFESIDIFTVTNRKFIMGMKEKDHSSVVHSEQIHNQTKYVCSIFNCKHIGWMLWIVNILNSI